MRLQLNARVANYILSTLSPDTTSWLFKEYKRFEDAHDIWATLNNVFASKAQEQANTSENDSQEGEMNLCYSIKYKEEQEEQLVQQSLHAPDCPVPPTGLSGRGSEAEPADEEQR